MTITRAPRSWAAEIDRSKRVVAWPWKGPREWRVMPTHIYENGRVVHLVPGEIIAPLERERDSMNLRSCRPENLPCPTHPLIAS